MGEGVRRRITRRVMPYLFTLYVIAFLDRVNVSYARLQMDRETSSRSTSTKYVVNWTSGEPALIAPIANVIAMTMTMTTKIAISAVHGPGDE